MTDVNSKVQICIGKNDDRTFSTKLQAYTLEIALGRSRHDNMTNLQNNA